MYVGNYTVKCDKGAVMVDVTDCSAPCKVDTKADVEVDGCGSGCLSEFPIPDKMESDTDKNFSCADITSDMYSGDFKVKCDIGVLTADTSMCKRKCLPGDTLDFEVEG